jgi:predicted aldo/keto reductase-like oxidoreductase
MPYMTIELILATSEESIELQKDYKVSVRITRSIPSESSKNKNDSKEILNTELDNCKSGYIKVVKVRHSVEICA